MCSACADVKPYMEFRPSKGYFWGPGFPDENLRGEAPYWMTNKSEKEMYVVLVNHKSKEAISDLLAHLKPQFPAEVFTFEGSEEQGYKFRIEGVGDEKAPRKIAEKYLKTWKPKPKEDEVIIIPVPVDAKVIKPKMNMDAMLKSILPKGK